MVAMLKIFSYFKRYPKDTVIINTNEINHIKDTAKLKPYFEY